MSSRLHIVKVNLCGLQSGAETSRFGAWHAAPQAMGVRICRTRICRTGICRRQHIRVTGRLGSRGGALETKLREPVRERMRGPTSPDRARIGAGGRHMFHRRWPIEAAACVVCHAAAGEPTRKRGRVDYGIGRPNLRRSLRHRRGVATVDGRCNGDQVPS